MSTLLRNAVAALGFLAAVVGVYLALDFVKIAWVTWWLVGASLLFAALLKLWPVVRIEWKKWRDYPRLAGRVAQLESRILKLKTGRDEAVQNTEMARVEGISEGRAQIAGAILAARAELPRISAIADYDGQLSLVADATGAEIAIGARFRLVVSATGALRGVVQVAAPNSARGGYFLICVEPSVPAFWKSLRDRVDIDTDPPNGVKLERSLLDPSLSNHENLISLNSPSPEV